MASWTTNYPTSIDTLTEQPAVTNGAVVIDASQINSLSAAARALESQVGSNLLESGSLRSTTMKYFNQKSVKLTWSSTTLINIGAWPGENIVTYALFQDNIWNRFN